MVKKTSMLSPEQLVQRRRGAKLANEALQDALGAAFFESPQVHMKSC